MPVLGLSCYMFFDSHAVDANNTDCSAVAFLSSIAQLEAYLLRLAPNSLHHDYDTSWQFVFRGCPAPEINDAKIQPVATLICSLSIVPEASPASHPRSSASMPKLPPSVPPKAQASQPRAPEIMPKAPLPKDSEAQASQPRALEIIPELPPPVLPKAEASQPRAPEIMPKSSAIKHESSAIKQERPPSSKSHPSRDVPKAGAHELSEAQRKQQAVKDLRLATAEVKAQGMKCNKGTSSFIGAHRNSGLTHNPFGL